MRRTASRLRFALCVAGLCLLFCPAESSAADATTWLDAANKNVADQEYFTAILNIRHALKENPSYAPAYLLLGDVFRSLQRFTDADSAYLAASALDPQNAGPAIRRLELYTLDLKQFDPAENLLKEVEGRFGHSAEIHYYRARILMGRYKYLEAVDELNLALALKERYFDAKSLLLDIMSVLNRRKDILTIADEILHDFPGELRTYRDMAEHLLQVEGADSLLLRFAGAPPELASNLEFRRLLARLNIVAERFPASYQLLKDVKRGELSPDDWEDITYLLAVSEAATGKMDDAIRRLAAYLDEFPDRPYLAYRLDLWLLDHARVRDPLRIRRAQARGRRGIADYNDNDMMGAFVHLYIARKLDPRSKDYRRYLAEAAWQLGYTEMAGHEINFARDLDKTDPVIEKRTQTISVGQMQDAPADRRVYSMFLFRMASSPLSSRPTLGVLYTDVLNLFTPALTPFKVSAIEPAIPFEAAERKAHQAGTDFFLYGNVDVHPRNGQVVDAGIFPVANRESLRGLEFKEQHVRLRSATDPIDDFVVQMIKSMHALGAQYGKVVRKGREGQMVLDVGRVHGVNRQEKYMIEVEGGPLYADMVVLNEWFSIVQVQEVNRARYVGVGDYFQRSLKPPTQLINTGE